MRGAHDVPPFLILWARTRGRRPERRHRRTARSFGKWDFDLRPDPPARSPWNAHPCACWLNPTGARRADAGQTGHQARPGRHRAGFPMPLEEPWSAQALRSGIQSVPRGQLEAARASGLGYWPAMRTVEQRNMPRWRRRSTIWVRRWPQRTGLCRVRCRRRTCGYRTALSSGWRGLGGVGRVR